MFLRMVRSDESGVVFERAQDPLLAGSDRSRPLWTSAAGRSARQSSVRPVRASLASARRAFQEAEAPGDGIARRHCVREKRLTCASVWRVAVKRSRLST